MAKFIYLAVIITLAAVSALSENINLNYTKDLNCNISAKEVNKTKPVYVKDMSSAVLSCSIIVHANQSVGNVTWFKGHEKNSTIKLVPVAKKKDVQIENNVLNITTPKIEDAGLYVVKFDIHGQPNGCYACQVDFTAPPFVQDFDKAKNLIEGDKMTVLCIVKGYPQSVVTWYKNNQTLSKTDGRYIIQHTFDDHQNIHLSVNNVEFSDEGEYTCEAYSAHFNETSRKSLTVSVKDKLAALWPFLGIVGEVVVLCTIIFIYEKRRNKQVELAEKAAEEVDGSSAEKKEGLRHRTSNNPTA